MIIKDQPNNSIFDKFDLSDEQFSEIQVTYAIIEPLLSDYLTPYQKKMMRLEVCQKLEIAERNVTATINSPRYAKVISPFCSQYIPEQEIKIQNNLYTILLKHILFSFF